MNQTELYVLGAEFKELKYDGVWDWFISTTDVHILWKNQPTYILSQIAFIFGGIATLIHALTKGGRLPYLWLGIFLHGLVIETFSYALPNVDNFWHSQTPIMFLGRRLPLHIMFLYPCFNYNASIGVAKMRLPKWAEPFAVGLCSVLIDIPYDVISVNFLHWTWHDTDPNIADRHYWVPWNSYYFHSTFACSFTFWFHYTRSKICESEGKWIADKSIFKELLCTIIASLLGTPGGVLLFLPIYHPLHDIWKIHGEVTYFIVLTIYLCIIWSADRKPKTDSLKDNVKHHVSWSTCLLIVYLIIHYSTFFCIAFFFDAQNEIAIGLKEPVGPCDEYIPIQTIFGVLEKRKWLCVTDYDEKYFDWHCLPGGRPPSDGSSWYTACGVELPNRVEYIVIAVLSWFLATIVFGNLHFLSAGDSVFTTQQNIVTKKKKKYL
ncbi:hypothetical protein WA026_020595 [Henosepilachna vigintioctopunctata]|uniref:DUF7802 domain-containing protein n=1 Tax=Henosepilachna vigintioctopunctata TaxID=420089 RepID=A0AAW1V2X0_9CUCU